MQDKNIAGDRKRLEDFLGEKEPDSKVLAFNKAKNRCCG
jgi:hypothetical protein